MEKWKGQKYMDTSLEQKYNEYGALYLRIGMVYPDGRNGIKRY